MDYSDIAQQELEIVALKWSFIIPQILEKTFLILSNAVDDTYIDVSKKPLFWQLG